jgi:hypothetical protein
MIYIQTNIAGTGKRIITPFYSRDNFAAYGVDATACACGDHVNRSDTIAEICEKLYDGGMGTGQRWHRRISRKDAEKLAPHLF